MLLLNTDNWESVFWNAQKEGAEINVVWVKSRFSSNGKWCLCMNNKILESGFNSKDDALERLGFLESLFLQ